MYQTYDQITSTKEKDTLISHQLVQSVTTSTPTNLIAKPSPKPFKERLNQIILALTNMLPGEIIPAVEEYDSFNMLDSVLLKHPAAVIRIKQLDERDVEIDVEFEIDDVIVMKDVNDLLYRSFGLF